MSQPIRILALFGGGVVFGQERGNIEALVALQKMGCEVLCIVRDDPWAAKVPEALDAHGLAWVKAPYIEHLLPGRLMHVLFRNPVRFIRANARLAGIARSFRPTHIHGFNQLYVFNFALALAMMRVPMVFRAGDEPTTHNFVWRATLRFAIWRTTAYVANSRYVADELRSHGVEEERITVIYNRPPRRVQGPAPFSIAIGGEGKVVFTFAGQIIPDKGSHLLVDAVRLLAREHPHVHLVMAGRISDWEGDAWARALRDSVRDDPLLATRVQFVGEVDDVAGLLERSAVHVSPSICNESSPNIVMEAKQAGRPSVVFPRGGMPELVEPGVDGYVSREATAASLAEVLEPYLRDPSLAARHGEAARRSLAAFKAELFAERWLAVYLKAGVRSPAAIGAARRAGEPPSP